VEGTSKPARMMGDCCTSSKWAWGEDCSCRCGEASWEENSWEGSWA
jgi:hypothetical protein